MATTIDIITAADDEDGKDVIISQSCYRKIG